MIPLNPILIVEVFDVWGIDFMGPFPNSLVTYISLLSLIMFLSGLRSLHVELMITRL